MPLRRPKPKARPSLPPRVPGYARSFFPALAVSIFAVLGLGWFFASQGPLWLQSRNWHPPGGRVALFGLAVVIGVFFIGGGVLIYERRLQKALWPLPLVELVRYSRRGLHGLFKTFFVREGYVVGDRKRIEQENQRPGLGLALVDGVSAAVFRDHRSGGLYIAGPGVNVLYPQHRLVATLALRPLVVVYGGNAWAQKPPPGARETRAALGGVHVSAQLLGIFALLRPEDYAEHEEPWRAWLTERAVALGEPIPSLKDEEAKRKAQAFARGRFMTVFHGHEWSARDFAEAVLTDVLERTPENAPAGVPELLNGARPLFQALLRDAWLDEVIAVGEVDKLFAPLHPGNEQVRWIDEVQRAVQERFTQPSYRPAGQTRPEQTRSSREYWQLRKMGLKALTVKVRQVFLPPKAELALASSTYEPLLELVERLKGQALHYQRDQIGRQARRSAALVLAMYMATRYRDGLFPWRPLDVLGQRDPEAFVRLLLALSEGAHHWLEHEGHWQSPRDPRLEYIRRVIYWLRAWLQRRGGVERSKY